MNRAPPNAAAPTAPPFGLLLLVLLQVSELAIAQDRGSAAGTPGAVRPFDVTIVDFASSSLAFGDPILLSIRVTPTTDVTFGDFELVPQGSLQLVYGPPTTSEGGIGPTCELNGPSSVTSGATIMATCVLVARDGRRFWRPSAWFIPPGRQQISVKIPVLGDQAQGINFSHEISAAFRAPLDAIFIGGLTGAFLLAVFAAVKERASTGPAAVEIQNLSSLASLIQRFASWLLGLIPRFWTMLMQTVMGGICALILILLAQSTEGISPPISIRIQDFWGGVVVGLFSIPLSRWIWEQVRPDSTTRGRRDG
jgi:hypothetical protein